MANELALTLSFSGYKPSIMPNALGMAFTNLLRNWGGFNYVSNTFLLPITSTLVPLGSVTTPRYGVFVNEDTTNYLTLYNGVSGAVFARLIAGDPAFVPLDPTMTLYGKSDTAPCQLTYLLFSS